MNNVWVEKYRPKTVGDCVLPDRLKLSFQECVDKKQIPSMILHGTAGVGKTTIAKAMCDEVGLDYLVINGSDESGIDTFRYKIKTYASSLSLSGGKKVIIIDEADYLNANSTQPALRAAIEEFAKNCTFIFTCNYKSRIIEPLHSRCASIDFTLKPDEKAIMQVQFFKIVKGILESENVEYDSSVVAEFVKKHFPDFRKTINELQWYSKFGKIDIGILCQIQDVKIGELINFVRDSDFRNMRQWIGSNEINPNVFFSQVYNALNSFVEPASIPTAVVILAEYQYKHAFVADHEINIVACLTEIMQKCHFEKVCR